MTGNRNIATELQEYLRPGKRSWVIFWISVVGLFLEMLFIRWIGTEVRIFAYLQNTILIASFLGIGLGCFTCQKEINLRQALIPMVILVTLLAVPVTRKALGNISELLSIASDFVIWGMVQTTSLAEEIILVVLGLFLTYVIVMLVVDIFVPFGRLLGRSMDAHPNTIWAYSVNLAGSLVGTLLFVLMSFFQLPPFAWFIVFGIMMLIFAAWDRKNRKVILALVAVIIAISALTGWIPGAKEVIWSPYQKLVLLPAEILHSNERGLAISVNNVGYQGMNDLRETSIDADPAFYSPEMKGFSQYDMPLLLHPDPQSFLIIGAGSGNDAAGGVRHGVKDITAVDIDPVIIDIGSRFHPELPYSSPTVHVVNDDARSFFATTDEKYDVISFGLLDSHTSMVMTNTRLDHYVYTRESIERAKALLNDHGIMTLTFQIQRPYIGDRIFSVLSEVFGYDPMVFYIPATGYGWGGTVFVTGDLKAVQQQIDKDPKLAAFITKMQQEYPFTFTKDIKIATDDWPYLYQEKPGIPSLFFFLAVLMAVVLVRSAWRWEARNLAVRWHRSHWHFFFLGAGFLLLEVQNVSKAAVVLGNTWQVNAVIVSSVLAMALVANFLAHRFPKIKIEFAYTGLFAITLALYFIDLSQFAFLPYVLKALIVGSLTTLPMLFSGIIFVRSFASAVGKDEALGANMIGSLAGGLLQSVTFLIGIKALLLVVFVLYALSAVMLVMQRRGLVPSENPA